MTCSSPSLIWPFKLISGILPLGWGQGCGINGAGRGGGRRNAKSLHLECGHPGRELPFTHPGHTVGPLITLICSGGAWSHRPGASSGARRWLQVRVRPEAWISAPGTRATEVTPKQQRPFQISINSCENRGLPGDGRGRGK